MTPRQLDALRCIATSIRERQRPPTRQEIANALGVSRTSAAKHVARLEHAGLVVREPFTVCGLSVTDEGRARLAALPPERSAVFGATRVPTAEAAGSEDLADRIVGGHQRQGASQRHAD